VGVGFASSKPHRRKPGPLNQDPVESQGVYWSCRVLGQWLDTLAQQDFFGLQSERMYTPDNWEGEENLPWLLQLRRSTHEFQVIRSKKIP
jgi:hypothetical protein